VHKIPENVSIPNVHNHKHVIFCLIGIDKCHAVSAVIVLDFPYFKGSR
jgi:hypothetical protein